LFTLPLISVLAVSSPVVHGSTRILAPGQSVQQAIDHSDDGDVIVLKDGVYHETLNVHKSITLKAEYGGEATLTNRYAGPIAWQQASPGSRTWFAQGIDWPVHRLLVEGVHAFDYRSRKNFDNRTCGPYWSKGWQADSYSYTKPPIYFAHDAATETLVLQDYDALAITTTEEGGPLTIDHNLWWPGGGRVMKLSGTGRRNNGVQFLHNTYFTGSTCSHNTFGDSIFENNIMLSDCKTPGCWTPRRLGTFFPTRYNLLRGGERYTVDFQGLTADPKLGRTPEDLFLLQPGSPAIDAGVARRSYHQDNVTDGTPDLGALEYGQSIDDWREHFGHVGPTWITTENAVEKAPHRPAWPEAVDPRWGGLDGRE
jgi:hypothetical protein